MSWSRCLSLDNFGVVDLTIFVTVDSFLRFCWCHFCFCHSMIIAATRLCGVWCYRDYVPRMPREALMLVVSVTGGELAKREIAAQVCVAFAKERKSERALPPRQQLAPGSRRIVSNVAVLDSAGLFKSSRTVGCFGMLVCSRYVRRSNLLRGIFLSGRDKSARQSSFDRSVTVLGRSHVSANEEMCPNKIEFGKEKSSPPVTRVALVNTRHQTYSTGVGNFVELPGLQR